MSWLSGKWSGAISNNNCGSCAGMGCQVGNICSVVSGRVHFVQGTSVFRPECMCVLYRRWVRDRNGTEMSVTGDRNGTEMSVTGDRNDRGQK
eukprot:350322-Chlamydomonas_euryale.AAC.3